MTSRLGVVTVGQSPRNDIVPEMKDLLGPAVDVLEVGALDGLSEEACRSLVPPNDGDALCTCLASGTSVVVSKFNVIPLMQDRIDQLNRDGVHMILLLCTDLFPAFNSQALVVSAGEIFEHAIQGVIKNGPTLGVMVPLPEQEAQAHKDLAHVTSKVVVCSASPYEDKAGFRRAAEAFCEHAPDLIVLHCMGYTSQHRRLAREATNVPVMTASSMVARTLAELLS